MIDVLICVASSFTSWRDARGLRQRLVLERNGVSSMMTSIKDFLELQDLLDSQKPKVVFNELWYLSPDVIEKLSRKFPKSHFVTIEHQSPSLEVYFDLESHYSCKERLRWLARERYNCWCATVMEKRLFPSYFLELPNIVPSLGFSKRNSEEFVVSIVCRYDKIKNISSQIQAVCEFSRNKGRICLLIVSHSLHLLKRNERALVEAKVPYRVLPWQEHQIYLDLVDQFVDVGLQCSLTESFNMVAAEHMMMGKPVISGDAIEFTLPELRVRAHRVDEIVEKLEFARNNLDALKKKSREVVWQVAERNERVFFETLDSLMK